MRRGDIGGGGAGWLWPSFHQHLQPFAKSLFEVWQMSLRNIFQILIWVCCLKTSWSSCQADIHDPDESASKSGLKIVF